MVSKAVEKAPAAGTVRYTVDELCEVYLNEDIHTNHVTQLALALFDSVQSWTGLSRNDRRILEAAARLHDVGYAMDPRGHLWKSIEIVRTEGLDGYPASQVSYICAAMSLHQGGGRPGRRNPALDGVPRPDRALRIGALLAIADGLDQSHIQDAVIRSVTRQGSVVYVTVSSPLSPDNLVRADAKACLWRMAFPMDIRMIPDPADRRLTMPGTQAGDNFYEAIRLHAYFLFKRVRGLESGAKAGRSTEPLHDMRVALRRLRTLLKGFQKPLKDTWAGDIQRRLGVIGDALGAARDYDVWVERMDALERTRDLSRSRVWKRYRSYQASFADGHLEQVRQVLNGPRYRNTMQEMAYFLRIQLPELARIKKDQSIESYMAPRIWRGARRVIRAEVPGGQWDAEEFHAFRKKCRRNRYLAEFFGGALGPATRRWGRICKAMADALGDLHDTDVGLERLGYDAVAAPRVLTTALREQRQRALLDVESAWSALKDPRVAERLRKELR